MRKRRRLTDLIQILKIHHSLVEVAVAVAAAVESPVEGWICCCSNLLALLQPERGRRRPWSCCC